MTTSWHLVASLVIKIFDIVKIVVVTSAIIDRHPSFQLRHGSRSQSLPWSPIKSCTLNVLLNNVDGQCDVDNLFIAVDDPQGHVESRLRNGGKTFHGQQNGRLGIHVGGRNAFMGPGAERGLVGLKSLDSHVLELTCIKTSDGVLLAGRTRGEHV